MFCRRGIIIEDIYMNIFTKLLAYKLVPNICVRVVKACIMIYV